MAVVNAMYLTGEDIATRAGVHDTAYMTEDWKWILDVQDLKRVRLMPEEYITGLDVEQISTEKAKELISLNHYRRYDDMIAEEESAEQTEEVAEQETTEEAADNEETEETTEE